MSLSIQEALSEAKKLLPPDQAFEALILLKTVLKKNTAYLIAHPEILLSPLALKEFEGLMQRRASGEPIAYLLGTRDFWSLSLKVTKDTLIPRHETELLVEVALAELPEKQALELLDLGTGSGAIALALSQERPHWQLHASDFSAPALALAKENAKLLDCNKLRFYESNWFDRLPRMHFDAIISNPPYIAADDPHLKNLSFEPLSALSPGKDPLADLHLIIKGSPFYLKPKGLLLLEHGFDQKNALQKELKNCGYKRIKTWQDLAGHDRVTGAWFEA